MLSHLSSPAVSTLATSKQQRSLQGHSLCFCCFLPPHLHFLTITTSPPLFFSYVLFYIISSSSVSFKQAYQEGSRRGQRLLLVQEISARSSRQQRQKGEHKPQAIHGAHRDKLRSLGCAISPVLTHVRRRGALWYFWRPITPRQHITRGLPGDKLHSPSSTSHLQILCPHAGTTYVSLLIWAPALSPQRQPVPHTHRERF